MGNLESLKQKTEEEFNRVAKNVNPETHKNKDRPARYYLVLDELISNFRTLEIIHHLDGYSFDLNHLGTLYMMDRTKQGRFCLEDLLEFVEFGFRFNADKYNPRTDFKSQLHGYCTWMMWNDVIKLGDQGIANFIQWFGALANEYEKAYGGAPVYKGYVFLGRGSINMFWKLMNMKDTYGVSLNKLFQLMQRSALEQKIQEKLQALDTPRRILPGQRKLSAHELSDYVPMKILRQYARDFIESFVLLMFELGFESEGPMGKLSFLEGGLTASPLAPHAGIGMSEDEKFGSSPGNFRTTFEQEEQKENDDRLSPQPNRRRSTTNPVPAAQKMEVVSTSMSARIDTEPIEKGEEKGKEHSKDNPKENAKENVKEIPKERRSEVKKINPLMELFERKREEQKKVAEKGRQKSARKKAPKSARSAKGTVSNAQSDDEGMSSSRRIRRKPKEVESTKEETKKEIDSLKKETKKAEIEEKIPHIEIRERPKVRRSKSWRTKSEIKKFAKAKKSSRKTPSSARKGEKKEKKEVKKKEQETLEEEPKTRDRGGSIAFYRFLSMGSEAMTEALVQKEKKVEIFASASAAPTLVKKANVEESGVPRGYRLAKRSNSSSNSINQSTAQDIPKEKKKKKNRHSLYGTAPRKKATVLK